jgi:polysaccharide pyruvyl transferase WcaK-like protein
MKIIDFLNSQNLDDSMIIGYYGGGNFGDELLMEVLLNILERQKVKNLKVLYLSYIGYEKYHRKFNKLEIVSIKNKFKFFYKLIRSKNIIIGGGGIWGLDFNFNVFILSLIIFISKFVFFKNIFLLGIGYYNSTTILGRFAASLVGVSSDVIIARDSETYKNFRKVSKKVYIDRDIAFNFFEIDINQYAEKISDLEKRINIFYPTIFITIRRFSGRNNANYQKAILEVIQKNISKKICISLFETKEIDVDGYKFLTSISINNKNITILDFDFNPVALFFLFQKHNKDIIIISPQFHGQVMANVTNTPFLPISYDNKNSELFNLLGIKNFIKFKDITYLDMQKFIDNFYE